MHSSENQNTEEYDNSQLGPNMESPNNNQSIYTEEED